MKLFERLFKYISLAILLCFFSPITASSQDNKPTQQADSIEISLLTCGPRQQVYSMYGHTAIRFLDKQSGRDLVVNYGVFSFDKPALRIRTHRLRDWHQHLRDVQLGVRKHGMRRKTAGAQPDCAGEDGDSTSHRPQLRTAEPRVSLQLLLRQLHDTCPRHYREQPERQGRV